MLRNLILLLSLASLFSCSSPPPERAWKSIEKSLQTQLITAHDGDTVDIPEGNFMFTRSLTLDGKSNIVIRGQGMEKTILSWQNQSEGAQGFQVSNSRNIVLENFSVEDAKGDNLKVNDTQGITIRRVRSVWTSGPRPENGAYAIYPVLCKRVLMEECIAMGASDAGIYVGQSDSVIIRNNVAYWNVAGIEAENSRWVEIYGNEAYDNTGGLLIFDLPGLTQYGHSTRAHHNRIHDNNHENFAQEGNIVASIPPGSGIMILATHGVRLHDNEIKDNRSVGVAIISYVLVAALNEGVEEQPGAVGGAQTVNNRYKEDILYNPYPYDITIFENRASNSHWLPSLGNDIGKLLVRYSPFSPPDFIFDGIADPERPERMICFFGNEGASFINLDAGNDFNKLSKDISSFECRPADLRERP